MEHHARNVAVEMVTFFGRSAASSAELIIGVDEKPRINPGDQTTVFSYKVANLEGKREQIYKAAAIIIKAYIEGQRITLDYVLNGKESPWLTKLSTGSGECLTLEPGPVPKQ